MELSKNYLTTQAILIYTQIRMFENLSMRIYSKNKQPKCKIKCKLLNSVTETVYHNQIYYQIYIILYHYINYYGDNNLRTS